MREQQNITYEDLLPAGMCTSVPAQLPFFLYHHRKDHEIWLNRISRNIESSKTTMLATLEDKLGLRFNITTRDTAGNVCFADDPNLRPEFRNSFVAIDLWDYYYAQWHNPRWWEERIPNEQYLQWPDPGGFWKSVALGKNLRMLHTVRPTADRLTFIVPESREVRIKQVDDRFRYGGASETTGRLYLNEHHFISRVPRAAWDYFVANGYPLRDYFDVQTDQVLDSDQIRSLCQWIQVIERTNGMVMK